MLTVDETQTVRAIAKALGFPEPTYQPTEEWAHHLLTSTFAYCMDKVKAYNASNNRAQASVWFAAAIRVKNSLEAGYN